MSPRNGSKSIFCPASSYIHVLSISVLFSINAAKVRGFIPTGAAYTENAWCCKALCPSHSIHYVSHSSTLCPLYLSFFLTSIHHLFFICYFLSLSAPPPSTCCSLFSLHRVYYTSKNNHLCWKVHYVNISALFTNRQQSSKWQVIFNGSRRHWATKTHLTHGTVWHKLMSRPSLRCWLSHQA